MSGFSTQSNYNLVSDKIHQSIMQKKKKKNPKNQQHGNKEECHESTINYLMEGTLYYFPLVSNIYCGS